jgi:hypothetical protein
LSFLDKIEFQSKKVALYLLFPIQQGWVKAKKLASIVESIPPESIGKSLLISSLQEGLNQGDLTGRIVALISTKGYLPMYD